MTEFEILMESLGTATVGHLHRHGLRSLVVYGHPTSGEAHIDVDLEDDSWSTRREALKSLLEVRLLFLDELSIDFSFGRDEDFTVDADVQEIVLVS